MYTGQIVSNELRIIKGGPPQAFDCFANAPKPYPVCTKGCQAWTYVYVPATEQVAFERAYDGGCPINPDKLASKFPGLEIGKKNPLPSPPAHSIEYVRICTKMLVKIL